MRKTKLLFTAVAPVAALLLCFVASGCRSKPHSDERHGTGLPSLSGSDSTAGIDMFDLRAHPDAIVLKPIDPATLTPSQRQFGIAPRLDPRVQYQPDIILMEHGDQAIRSIASNGIVWTFDANAPHVNEFAMGKVVFATGRAVGRVAMLKREGDSVQVILLPVTFHDLLAKGTFAMDSDIDMNQMTPYVYPDFPQPQEEEVDQVASLPTPGVDGWKGQIVVSRVSKSGKWTPVNLTTVSAEGERKRYQRIGRRWETMPVYDTAPLPRRQREEFASPRLIRAAYQIPSPSLPVPPVDLPKKPDLLPPGIPKPPDKPSLKDLNRIPGAPDLTKVPGASGLPPVPGAADPGKIFMMPGVPGPGIRMPVLSDYHPPTLPNLPRMNVDDLVPGIVKRPEGVGVAFTYEKQGIHIEATALLNFSGTRVKAFYTPGGVLPKDCGIEMQGVVGVHLHLKSHTDQSWRVNIRKLVYLPLDLYIPIGGAVPFSVTMSQAIALTTGFSARANSILNAEGRYAITGNLRAGYFNGDWAFDPTLKATAKTDIGNTTEGISIGIGSLLLGAHLRVMLGLGAGPFNFGVFAKLIYTGTILKAPDETLPCRQGTMVVTLKSGLGYSLPAPVAKAVNALLSFFTDQRIEAKGDILDGPDKNLLTETTQYPDGCAGPKGGG